MRPIYMQRSLSVAADADGISVDAQVPLGALVLGGALVVSGVAQLTAQRKVIFTPGAGDNLSAITFTIVGTDDQGHALTEAIVGGNNVVVQSVLDYKTVTSITASAASGAGVTVSVGTNGVGASVPIPMDQMVPDFSVTLAAAIRSGAADYTVQFTMDNVFDSYNMDTNQTQFMTGYSAGRPDRIKWWDHSTMTAQAVDAKGVLTEPVRAVRLVTNSGVGNVELQVVQGGTA